MLTNSYGTNLVWCTVRANKKHHKVIGIIWEVAIMLYKWINIVIISYKFQITINYFNARENDIKNRLDKKEEKNYIRKSRYIMYAFPLILIFMKVPCLFDWVFYLFFNKSIKVIMYIEAFSGPLIGFFNALIFLIIHSKFI